MVSPARNSESVTLNEQLLIMRLITSVGLALLLMLGLAATAHTELEGAAPVLFQPGDGIDGACDGRAVFVAAAFRGIPMAADGDDSHVPCGGWAGDGA